MEIRQKSFDTIFFSYICKVLSVSWIETIIFSLQKKHQRRIMPEASPICIKSIKKKAAWKSRGCLGQNPQQSRLPVITRRLAD